MGFDHEEFSNEIESALGIHTKKKENTSQAQKQKGKYNWSNFELKTENEK